MLERGAAAAASERITMVAVKQPLLKTFSWVQHVFHKTRRNAFPVQHSSYLDETEISIHGFYAARKRDTDTQEHQQQDPQST